MKSLFNYLQESIEDNLFWKIDKYFERDKTEFNTFIDLVDYCRKNPSFNKQTIENYLIEHPFKSIKKFIDFLDDVIKIDTTDRDYVYMLSIVIKKIISDKSDGIRYTKIKEALIKKNSTILHPIIETIMYYFKIVKQNDPKALANIDTYTKETERVIKIYNIKKISKPYILPLNARTCNWTEFVKKFKEITDIDLNESDEILDHAKMKHWIQPLSLDIETTKFSDRENNIFIHYDDYFEDRNYIAFQMNLIPGKYNPSMFNTGYFLMFKLDE